MRTNQKRTAFTLIEVLIVVVIMAVLAATVIPQFASSTEDAKNSSLKFNMHTLRSQIELYKIHHGVYPNLTNNSLPQLLGKTDAAGNADANGAFGPYLDGDIPPNPFDNDNKVYAAASDSPAAATAEGAGWQYHQATGGIWPNNPGYWP
jgi:type II secretion system protein G